jgi:hypothetical protein
VRRNVTMQASPDRLVTMPPKNRDRKRENAALATHSVYSSVCLK